MNKNLITIIKTVNQELILIDSKLKWIKQEQESILKQLNTRKYDSELVRTTHNKL